jgi:hypothetical protein
MDATTLITADAVFEGALGLSLIGAPASGALGGADFPHPVGRVVVLAVGIALVIVAVVIWRGTISLRGLAIANVATALAGIVWVAAASGFSAAGATVVAVTIGGLLALAAAQFMSGGPRPA